MLRQLVLAGKRPILSDDSRAVDNAIWRVAALRQFNRAEAPRIPLITRRSVSQSTGKRIYPQARTKRRNGSESAVLLRQKTGGTGPNTIS